MSTIPETISLLEQYNKWRRGDDTITMPETFELGVAIGDAVRLLREHVTLQAEFEKVTLLAAQVADRNVELRFRAEKAEAELAAASQGYDGLLAIHGTVLEDLSAEREKVRVLREALDDVANSGELMGYWFLHANAVLAATKEASK